MMFNQKNMDYQFIYDKDLLNKKSELKNKFRNLDKF